MPARLACGCLLAALVAMHGRATTITPATEQHVEFDSARSACNFRVRLMWFIGVRGEFGGLHGDVERDPVHDQLRVNARIDVNSVRMSSKRYEDWVKSPEFFDAERHPQIEFTSSPFPRERLKNGGELPGELVMRGVRLPVRFMLQPARCPTPAYECPIEVRGVISRSRFGIAAHRGSLGDEVKLDFSVFAVAPRQGDAPLSGP